MVDDFFAHDDMDGLWFPEPQPVTQPQLASPGVGLSAVELDELCDLLFEDDAGPHVAQALPTGVATMPPLRELRGFAVKRSHRGAMYMSWRCDMHSHATNRTRHCRRGGACLAQPGWRRACCWAGCAFSGALPIKLPPMGHGPQQRPHKRGRSGNWLAPRSPTA